MTAQAAETFRFSLPSGDPWAASEAASDLYRLGANPTLAPLAWVSNHYRWIVWKLACLTRRFDSRLPPDFGFDRDTVLRQLCYRYEREINQNQRSSVKMLVERDDLSTRHMILCVCALNVKPQSSDNTSSVFIEVTDGWYSVHAMLDDSLSDLLRRGKIFVGLKLRLYGAQVRSSVLEFARIRKKLIGD